LVTSMTVRPIRVEGNDYLPTCKSNRNGDSTDHTGTVSLLKIKNDGTLASPKVAANHNYQCHGLVAVADNLILGGRILPHGLSKEKIAAVLTDLESPPFVELDETFVQGGVTHRLTSFTVKNIRSDSAASSQILGALKGLSVNAIDDMTFDLALTNSMQWPWYPGRDMTDASVTTVQMQGFGPRVVALLKPNLVYPNKSEVVASYTSGDQILPPDGKLPPGDPSWFETYPSLPPLPQGSGGNGTRYSSPPAGGDEGLWMNVFTSIYAPPSPEYVFPPCPPDGCPDETKPWVP
jgi:hypothetical protein